jgi:glycosyltransferase involved in cell wall biosynthesis
MNPVFSILVANYNNGRYLHECLNSIYAQTYTNWEVIIVDDASTDDESSAIYKQLETDKRFKIYYNKENKGCGYTKRKCVELANGDICGFLDPDDAITANAIELMVDHHNKNEKASMVYSNFYLCNENLEVIKKNDDGEFNKNALMIGKMPNHFTTFKKDAYNKTNGINPDFKRAIDRDLVLKLEEVGDVIDLNSYLYYYRTNPNSISMDNNRYRSTYWTWQARFNACERRGLDKEEMFDLVSKALQPKSSDNPLKKSWDYRIGNFLLAPIRFITKSQKTN